MTNTFDPINEQWRDIPGYEGLYQASTEGRIRTAEGKVTSSARFPHRVWKQRIMKFKYMYRKNTDKRDARVCLWKDGKERTFLVARLIAMTWCKGYQEGLTVNHKNGDTLDNRPENLEWITLADNIRHGFANGLMNTEKPCALIDECGNRLEFKSHGEASDYLGRNHHYITLCISKQRNAMDIFGRMYRIAS